MTVELVDDSDYLYNIRMENNQLRKQITYLQEELASVEDQVMILQRQLSSAQNWEC